MIKAKGNKSQRRYYTARFEDGGRDYDPKELLEKLQKTKKHIVPGASGRSTDLRKSWFQPSKTAFGLLLQEL